MRMVSAALTLIALCAGPPGEDLKAFKLTSTV